MNPNCIERRYSTVTPQALHLMNNGIIQQLSENFARRVRRQAGNDHSKQIEGVYLIALSRPPTEEEKALGVSALAKLRAAWAKQPNRADRDAATTKALATICHALMISAEFLYVD